MDDSDDFDTMEAGDSTEESTDMGDSVEAADDGDLDVDFDDIDFTVSAEDHADETAGESEDVLSIEEPEALEDTDTELEDELTEAVEEITDPQTAPADVITETKAADPDDITQLPEFVEWAKDMGHLDLDTQTAVYKAPEDRSPRETELADAALHPDYTAQAIFKTDPVTGAVLRDADGNFIFDNRRSAGTQAPDLFKQDADGKAHLIEDKTYNSVANLKQNIRQQTAVRRAAFGQDVDITYNLAPKFTVEEAEKLQDYCENKLGVDISW